MPSVANDGVVAKGISQRESILDAALTVFATTGYRRLSLREIAERTGLTQSGLLHHFGSRENLLTEVLRRKEHLAGRRRHDDVLGTPEGLAEALAENSATPGLVELQSVLATQAADDDHPAHAYFVPRYERMRAQLTVDIERRRLAGELPERADAEMVATALLALADGIQLQWMLDGRIDMPAHVAHVWDLIRSAR